MNNLVEVKDGKIVIAVQFMKEYAEFEKAKTKMDIKSKEVKEELKKVMEKNNITEFETDYLKVIYRKSTTKKDLDKTRLKEELPDIYEEYTKDIDVASSVVLKVK